MARTSPFSAIPLAGHVARMRWSHATLLLLAIFVAANWQLITGRAHEKWDAYALAAPYFSLLGRSIRVGELPIWNPWIAAGSPDFAVPGSGLFSPDLLLFVGLTGGGPQCYNYYWLLVWFAGGIGILLLGRQFAAPPWLGLTVGLGYLFSGFYTGHAEHLSVVYSHSLLPLIIWRLEVCLEEGRLLVAAQTGLLLGLSGLVGYPALTLGTAAIIVLWFAGRLFFARPDGLTTRGAILLLFVLISVAGCILLPSLFAVREAQGYSDRSAALGRDFALSSNALHPASLASLITPALPSVKLADPSFCSYTDVSCLSFYTGAAIVLLAAVALMARVDRAWRWLLFAAGIFALLAAMSYSVPLRGWIYDLVPPSRYFRHASMLRGYFLFAVTVLALLSFKSKITNANLASLRRAAYLLAPTAAAGYLVFAFSVMHVAIGVATTHAVVVWIIGMFAVAFFSRRIEHATPLPAIFVGLAIFDALGSYYLSRDTIFESGPRPAVSQAAQPLGSFARSIGTSSGNFNLFSEQATFKNYAPLKNRFYELSATYPQLGFVAIDDERTWFARNVPEVGLSRRIFDEFRDLAIRDDAPRFVRHSSEAMLGEYNSTDADLTAVMTAPTPERVKANIVTYTARHLVLDLVAPADGWVMLTERWARSWRAEVNGVEQPIEGANFIFRALKVAKGATRIEMVYKPPFIFPLLGLSWSTIGIVLALSLSLRRNDLSNRHKVEVGAAPELVAS